MTFAELGFAALNVGSTVSGGDWALAKACIAHMIANAHIHHRRCIGVSCRTGIGVRLNCDKVGRGESGAKPLLGATEATQSRRPSESGVASPLPPRTSRGP